ncbi:hypothetical protein [Roseomonas genomospecies 6]|uniref:Uncharacterized protein n=1 Tax=Roseomonas genomospecies 6 TaxID=214106 RepID=A0A9W7TY62_9PROT|nr:hypothetical protein [Roseomonas genomospecies 6]KAA0680615.1 hypothetical protein DS843_12265 [Roseomonas genomospecies 6]
MSHPSETGIRIIAATGRRFACDRPEHLLKHGDHTPLSRGIHDAVEQLFAEAGAVMPEDGSTIGVVGTSRFGELSTLDGVTRKHRNGGLYGIDPVVFSKANQFYPLFAIGRSFRCLGPASSLFTSGSGSAEVLYFAVQLLRRGDATHVLALDYDEDAPTGAVPVTGHVRALLLGHGNGRAEGRPVGPAITACRLGPHLTVNGPRAAALTAFLDRQAVQGGHQVLLAGTRDADTAKRMEAGFAVERLDAGRDTLAQVIDRLTGWTDRIAGETCLHVVPPGRGNILSVCCRFDEPQREGRA